MGISHLCRWHPPDSVCVSSVLCCTVYRLWLQCCFSPTDVAATLNNQGFDAVLSCVVLSWCANTNCNLCKNKNDFLLPVGTIENKNTSTMSLFTNDFTKHWRLLNFCERPDSFWEPLHLNRLGKKLLLLWSCYEYHWSCVSEEQRPALIATVHSMQMTSLSCGGKGF